MAHPTSSALEATHDPGPDVPPPPAPGLPASDHGGNALVRVTVNLNMRSHRALQKISSDTGMGKTDVINRSIQVYSLIEDLLDKGNGALTVVHADGSQERIYIL
jgi:hypothetical protein